MFERTKQLVFRSQNLGAFSYQDNDNGCLECCRFLVLCGFFKQSLTQKSTTQCICLFSMFEWQHTFYILLLSTCIVQNDSGILCKSNHLIGLVVFSDRPDSIIFHNLFEGHSIGSAIRRPKGLVGNNWWKRRGDVVAATNLPTCQSAWQREQLGTKTWGATCSCAHRFQMVLFDPIRLSKPTH